LDVILASFAFQPRHGMPSFQTALGQGIQPSLSVDVECNMTANMFSIMRATFTPQRALMGLLNAERFRHPYGAPTIHVSSDASDVVLADATRAAPARVVAESRYIPAAARNVVVAIRGSRPSSPPTVVMTPRSSWWQSTAERGGGLVCWLESLRALIAAPPACNVIFTATSGHELGHLGLDDFMARRPGWERPISEGGVSWIHFGANIGAANGELSLQSASNDLRQLTEAEIVRAGQAPDVVAPKTCTQRRNP
jgi:hypothetical protein